MRRNTLNRIVTFTVVFILMFSCIFSFNHRITRAEVTNLALNTAVKILDGDGSAGTEIGNAGWSGPASAAVDGNPETYTSAWGVYLWTLEDNLGSLKENVNKIVIKWDKEHPNNYANEYKVLLKTDTSPWTEAAHITNGTNADAVITFDSRDVQYIRIQAIQPNGGDRVMSIAELEVYAVPDITPPTCSMLTPESLENVNVDTDVMVGFSEPMDSSTLNSDNITLTDSSGSVIDAVYSVNSTNTAITLDPAANLQFGQSYTVSISNSVKDKAQNSVTGAKSWTFTTLAVAQELNIVTTSSTEYGASPGTSIYPAFVDNMPYQSWKVTGSFNYYQLKAAGGVAPYTWSLASGALPDGLLMGSDGKISGTPTAEGNFNFTVQVTDSLGTTSEKELVMEANPYRAKWFTDAKFGYMIQWGLCTYPFLYPEPDTKKAIEDFEARITEFDADEWAQELYNRGGRVLNFTAMGGDDIRLWPSTTPTQYEFKTTRDIVGELIAACHARGIKFIAYLPAHYGWGGRSDFSYDESLGKYTCAKMHEGIVGELLDKGADGFWFDVGGSIGVSEYLDWSKMIPLIRSKNPYATIESSPGTNGLGYALQYPNTDMVNYEGLMSDSADSLAVSVPNTTRKKLGIDVDNMLEYNWTWWEDSPRSMKPASKIIESIQLNWYNGATTVLSFTPLADGTLIPEPERETLDEISEWVNTHRDWCDMPVASLSDSVEYDSEQLVELSAEDGTTIYYTTDGTIPTIHSSIYTQPVSITESVTLKAIAAKAGKGNSAVMNKSYIIIPPTDTSLSMVKANIAPDSLKAGKPEREEYVGMKIVVGNKPVTVDRIGRYYAEGNQGKHNLKIVRASDNRTVAFTTIDMSMGAADASGFKYRRIAPVTLEAGHTYYVLALEDSSDLMWKGDLSQVVTESGIRIAGSAWTDYSGTRYYSSTADMIQIPAMAGSEDNKDGQLLDIKFASGTSETVKNLALGAVAYLEDNKGNPVGASIGKNVAQNAVDGDPGTVAQAGDEKWAWTLRVDLGSLKTGINKVVINAPSDQAIYATEYQIMLSRDGLNWSTAAHITGNSNLRYGATFVPTDARYVKVRSLKPDGAGQQGGQMAISELEIYNNNLALGTDAKLLDNNGNALDPVSGIHYANNAVDGNGSSRAQAAGQWAWTLEDDLGIINKGINRVALNFADGLYASEYDILLSTDGETWTTAAEVRNCTGGRSETAFAPTDARYVRIKAIKPDGPGQLGTQMAITELEVTNDVNIARGAGAYLQDNSGFPLPPCLTEFAEHAVDGNSSTYAQAANSYAWTLHVDLNSIKSGIGAVAVTFKDGLFATDYDVLLSVDGVQWEVVASDTDNTSFGRRVFTFAPKEARYVRVRANSRG